MKETRKRRWLRGAILLLCLSALSCRANRNVRTYHAPPPPDIQPTILRYVEADGFDEMFESALTSQNPVILIQTDTSQPDWGPHLNAWLAAWNQGGKVVDEPRRRVRMQAPLAPAVVNKDTIHEFRLLITDLMTRVEDLASRGSTWWSEERTQRRRIELLKPYSLRFHMDENDKIQLIFFNGRYAQYYQEVMDSLALSAAENKDGWSRGMTCSHSKGKVPAMILQRTRERSEE